jgi:hypothetical protein
MFGRDVEAYEKSVRIVVIPARIRTGHLPNTSQMPYCLNHLALLRHVEVVKTVDFADKLLVNLSSVGRTRLPEWR